jgi:hypothetical protein
MSRIARLMVYASVLSLLVSARVAADPVSINSGFLLATGPTGMAPVSVLGSGGFSVLGVAVVPPGHLDPFTDCSPCAPGAALSVGGALDNAFVGQAKVGGNTYPLTTSMNSPNPLSWELFGSAIAPPASMMGFALLQVPFTMTGSFSPNNAPGMPLSGHGMVSLLLLPLTVSEGQPFAWNVSIVNYNFSETAATPEPATLTLIGLGLAAGAVRMRRRRLAR